MVPGSVKSVKASGFSGFGTEPGAAGASRSLKDLTEALRGLLAGNCQDRRCSRAAPAMAPPRLLVASLGDGKTKQSFWWFAPLDQPEGWFDEHGRRLGGTALAESAPGSRMSSPFGTRRYYGRTSGGGFHNGIDFEGKTGEPIYAAADGVINHQGWYFNYGRTVKISHADNFETLYAHMSRFADGRRPGQPRPQGRPDRLCRLDRPLDRRASALLGDRERPVRRSRAVHLRRAAATARWAAAAGRLSASGSRRSQRAPDAARRSDNRFRVLQGAEPWSSNPFSSRSGDRLCSGTRRPRAHRCARPVVRLGIAPSHRNGRGGGRRDVRGNHEGRTSCSRSSSSPAPSPPRWSASPARRTPARISMPSRRAAS